MYYYIIGNNYRSHENECIAIGHGSLMLLLKANAYYHYGNIKDCSIIHVLQ